MMERGRLPRLSIGLPVFNGERYLAEAIESLLAQSFSDFELLILDNASTDATKRICADFCSRDQRIRYTRNAANIGEVINTALDAGVSQMIVLDLAGVGEDAGVRALDVCRRAAEIASARGVSLQLTSGGGVRDMNDLKKLAAAGCSAALVASALHDGRVTATDIRKLSA